MAKAIHSMIRVLDEARSVRFHGTAFGLGVADRFDFDDFRWSACGAPRPASSWS